MKIKKRKMKGLVIYTSVFFVSIVILGLVFCIKQIDYKLRQSNIGSAVDIALLVKRNFQITDAEVAYMKSLTFNEMEMSPINARLMRIGEGMHLQAVITNVYVLAPLEPDEIRYYTDETNADFFGYEVGTPLNGIWLLNGNIDENGKFQSIQREDICRYTSITADEKCALEEQKAFGSFTTDAWGEFITGYAPLYTVEGNFVGLLGIDMDPDKYQKDVHDMVQILVEVFFITTLAMIGLSLHFYFKYERIEKEKLYFDFYSRMSHDMRTPMNGIMGMVHLARTENDVTQLHSYFEKIGESSEYLLSLINDTLDVSRISNGKMVLHMEPVKCSHILQNIVDMIRDTARQHDLTFEVVNLTKNQETPVLMDIVRFKQIFANLLTNAVKYTPPGGHISFIQECLEETGVGIRYRFKVQDDGVGMSEKYIKKSLFQPFSQEQNEMSNHYAGSGLGLSITKSLVELMGGTITVESALGQGTTFTVELYLENADAPEWRSKLERGDDSFFPEEESAAKSNEKKDPHLEGIRILLCEDHPMNAEIAKKLLEKEGCEVTLAENGKAGVELFQQSKINQYDIILMDIRMPVMDGLQATRIIRASNRPDASTVPIVAMTANAYQEDIDNSTQAGMNAHLSKPIETRKLYRTIESLVQHIDSERN